MSAIPDLKLGYKITQKIGAESARYCIQCGKCAAICPLVRLREDYSPIEVVKGVSLGLKDMILSSDTIWRCLTCQACTKICPAGVKFQEFMEALRDALIEKGVTQYILRCKRCGKTFTTTPILEFAGKTLPKEVKVDEEYLMLCPECRRYTILSKSARWYGRGIV
ncbi:MAG: 4Fe-4S dicluster domain-containing protein [Candidatus Bathyarchaeales archaeon]